MRSVISACSRVAGTGRLQSLSRETNPAFHAVIERFDLLTGVPVVLNTSFNLRGEPMVHRPGEAVADFLRSEMDALVLGSLVSDKSKPGERRGHPATHSGVRRRRRRGSAAYCAPVLQPHEPAMWARPLPCLPARARSGTRSTLTVPPVRLVVRVPLCEIQ